MFRCSHRLDDVLFSGPHRLENDSALLLEKDILITSDISQCLFFFSIVYWLMSYFDMLSSCNSCPKTCFGSNKHIYFCGGATLRSEFSLAARSWMQLLLFSVVLELCKLAFLTLDLHSRESAAQRVGHGGFKVRHDMKQAEMINK